MFPITRVLIFTLTTPFITVLGAPAIDANSLKQNGISAQQLNAQFASLKKTDSCQGSAMACVEGSFGQCVSGKWQTTECASGTQCFALPLVNNVGTSISCDTQADAESRIGDTGASGGLTGLGSNGTSFAAVNSSFSDNCTDSNSATFPAATQTGALADAYGGGISSDNASNTSTALAAATSNSDCPAAVTTTVTVTFAASPFAASFSAAPTRSATIASGFTLPPAPTSTDVSGANATVSSGYFSSSIDASSSANLSSAQTSAATAIPTGFTNATITLTPASASSLLSSLSAANPGITISTAGDSSTAAASAVVTASPVTGDNAASASSSSPGALSLSLFSTTLANVTASASQASSAAAAFASPSTSAAAGGYGGSGY